MLEGMDKFTPTAITLCGSGETAQSVRCLPWKHKDWSLFLQNQKQKQGLGACACNPITGEAETGKSSRPVDQPA